MKAQISFLIKGLHLILILVVIAIVLNQLTSLFLTSSQQEKTLEMRQNALSILEILSSSPKCLAYEEQGKVENNEFVFGAHRILEVEKLKYFSSNFNDVQPDCARDFDFGYRIEVKTFPINFSSLEVISGGGVFDKILKIIDGKKVLFLIDVSGSMSDDSGTYCGQNVNKIRCVALFLGGISLDSIELCYDIGFINLMSDDSEISIYRYGFGSCESERILDLTRLDGKSVREDIKNKIKDKLGAIDNTPIAGVLKKAFDYAKNNGIEAVVLLTDGMETCDGDPVAAAEPYKNANIPVYTIAFGSADKETLEKIAEKTGGQFFDASTCEELLAITGEKTSLEIKSNIWEFGDGSFSKKDALKEVMTFSIPVIISLNQTTFLPGEMKIKIVDGELEKIRGFIDKSCLTGIDFKNSFSISYPVFLENDLLCMNIEKEKICQKIACKKTVNFEGILSPGKYTISTINKENVMEVKV